MFLEVVIALAMVAVYWYFHVRIPAVHLSLPTVTLQEASQQPWDYVVVGGGVSGAAALHSIAVSDPHASVLLIERGRCVDGGKLALPNYTFDLVGSEVDWNLRVARPFSEDAVAPSSPKTSDAAAARTKQGFKPYPRGKGIGGTQQLDHQLLFSHTGSKFGSPASQAEAVGLLHRMRDAWTSLASCRSPLSWAFAEVARKHTRIKPYLPMLKGEDGAMNMQDAMLKRGHVSPNYLWLNRSYGTRASVARHILDEVAAASRKTKRRWGVLLGTPVMGFTTSDDGGGDVVVTSVLCRGSLADTRNIIVGKGVVCCAGNFASVKLVAPLVRREWPWALMDTVSVPLIYEARPGLSDDPCNTQTFKNIFAWYAARRGGLLQVVSDTSVLLPSEQVPGASILITLVPCGGFSRQRFSRLGISPVLGVFKEAFHFNISMHTVPYVATVCAAAARDIGANTTPTASMPPPPLSSFIFEPHCSPMDGLSDLAIAPLANRHRDVVRSCLVEGIRFCRELVDVAPLSELTTRKEALDTSLFPAAERTNAFNVLYGKQGKNIREPVAALVRAQALKTALSLEYLNEYVERHSRYGGYASGSLSELVDATHLRLKGTRNLHVGDVSVVPPVVAATDGIHNAASISTALVVGAVAGRQAATTTA